jgi:hypothetical protein
MKIVIQPSNAKLALQDSKVNALGSLPPGTPLFSLQFTIRTPHRPNNIGLSIAKLDQIKGNTLYLSGVDLVSGTPILDVKPYIATYDALPTAAAPQWITEAPRPRLKGVKFTEDAEKQLQELVPKLRFYSSLKEICTAIEEVIVQDPRSVHFKVR